MRIKKLRKKIGIDALMHRFDWAHGIVGPIIVLLCMAIPLMGVAWGSWFMWYQNHEYNVKRNDMIMPTKDKGWPEMKSLLVFTVLAGIPASIWILWTGRGIV